MEGEYVFSEAFKMNKERAKEVIYDLSRKQLLLVGENDVAKRRELVENILEEEIEILKDLLGVE